MVRCTPAHRDAFGTARVARVDCRQSARASFPGGTAINRHVADNGFTLPAFYLPLSLAFFKDALCYHPFPPHSSWKMPPPSCLRNCFIVSTPEAYRST